MVDRWHPAGYVEVLVAERQERVRASRSIRVSVLFGEGEDEG